MIQIIFIVSYFLNKNLKICDLHKDFFRFLFYLHFLRPAELQIRRNRGKILAMNGLFSADFESERFVSNDLIAIPVDDVSVAFDGIHG